MCSNRSKQKYYQIQVCKECGEHTHGYLSIEPGRSAEQSACEPDTQPDTQAEMQPATYPASYPGRPSRQASRWAIQVGHPGRPSRQAIQVGHPGGPSRWAIKVGQPASQTASYFVNCVYIDNYFSTSLFQQDLKYVLICVWTDKAMAVDLAKLLIKHNYLASLMLACGSSMFEYQKHEQVWNTSVI